MKIQSFLRQLKQMFVVSMTAIMLCSGLWMLGAAPAYADRDAAEIAGDRAKQEVDRMAGSGTMDQIEGKAQEDLGKVQRQFGDTSNQVEGALRESKGRAQQGIGNVKSAADDAADDAEDFGQGLIDSVKDFFN